MYWVSRDKVKGVYAVMEGVWDETKLRRIVRYVQTGLSLEEAEALLRILTASENKNIDSVYK